MRQTLQHCVALAASSAVWVSGVCAATFPAPLKSVVVSAPRGDYLTAEFDFGVSFSQLESVSIDFSMPGGFENQAVVTGNSVSSHDLTFAVHESGTQPLTTPSGSRIRSLCQSIQGIPAGQSLTSLQLLGAATLNPNGGEVEFLWPEFLFAGRGVASAIDLRQFSVHFLPEGKKVERRETWAPPAGLTNATLTIVDTPVPEPAAAAFLTIALAILFPFRRLATYVLAAVTARLDWGRGLQVAAVGEPAGLQLSLPTATAPADRLTHPTSVC